MLLIIKHLCRNESNFKKNKTCKKATDGGNFQPLFYFLKKTHSPTPARLFIILKKQINEHSLPARFLTIFLPRLRKI